MNKLVEQLKKYDKFLEVRKLLDGTIKIIRQSPFSLLQFKVIDIQNQYIGSRRWVLRRINLMDTQHHDIVGQVTKSNYRLKHKKDDNRIHHEVADFLTTEQFIN
jgi:DNA-directed RNA polymerase delta subunit